MKHTMFVPEPRLFPSFALGEIGQSASFTTFLDSFMFATEAAGDR